MTVHGLFICFQILHLFLFGRVQFLDASKSHNSLLRLANGQYTTRYICVRYPKCCICASVPVFGSIGSAPPFHSPTQGKKR